MKEMLIDNKEKTSLVWLEDVQVECPLESKVMGYFTLQEKRRLLITEVAKLPCPQEARWKRRSSTRHGSHK